MKRAKSSSSENYCDEDEDAVAENSETDPLLEVDPLLELEKTKQMLEFKLSMQAE